MLDLAIRASMLTITRCDGNAPRHFLHSLSEKSSFQAMSARQRRNPTSASRQGVGKIRKESLAARVDVGFFRVVRRTNRIIAVLNGPNVAREARIRERNSLQCKFEFPAFPIRELGRNDLKLRINSAPDFLQEPSFSKFSLKIPCYQGKWRRERFAGTASATNHVGYFGKWSGSDASRSRVIREPRPPYLRSPRTSPP